MIGVIADDLTGAAEIGAVGLRHGLRAEIVTRGKPGKADLACMDTDSRSCEPKEAAKRAAAAAKMLRAAGAKWIYKKVDSVLRGQVTAEIEAVMKQLQLESALLAPANPSLGRTIHDGKYFVRGKLIHKTEFARDPQFPRRSARVLDLLKTPQTFPIAIGKLDGPLPEKGIVIAEAATTQDVHHWAARRTSKMLACGGAEFFGALLSAESLEKIPSSSEKISTNGARREFFVCGTSTVAARKFAAAARRDKVAIFSLPLELAWGAELLPAVSEAIGQRIVQALNSNPRVVLTVGLPSVRDISISQRLSNHVAQIAESALRHVEAGHVFAEGGATAAALVRRMGWGRLKILRELAPGVPTLAVAGRKNLLLTIKPGSYAWPAKWT